MFPNIVGAEQQPRFNLDPHPQQNSATPIVKFTDHVCPPSAVPAISWHERAITWLKDLGYKLEKLIPNFPIQDKIDELGRTIKSYFAPLKEFNKWLDDNGQGPWYCQLATFLAKLPLRAVRNIVRLLYAIIKTAIYAAVHPLKAINKLAQLLVSLAYQLTKPDTWSKMGAGIIGTSLGQSLVTGNPLSLIAIGIGAAMLIGGLSAGAIKAAVEAKQGKKWDAVKEHLLCQAKALPEAALTGFCLGLIIGGIQRAFQEPKTTIFRVTSMEEAEKLADQFIRDHGLPPPTTINLDSVGNITLGWEHQFFRPVGNQVSVLVNRAELILQPGGLPPIINAYGTQNTPYLPGIEFKWTYPTGS